MLGTKYIQNLQLSSSSAFYVDGAFSSVSSNLFFSGYLTFVTSMKVRQTRHPSNLKNMSMIIPKKKQFFFDCNLKKFGL